MDTRVVNESELWRRAKNNDGSAFTALFDLHRDRIFRHCLRLIENVHDAEEVTAASFFELWRRRDAVTLVSGSVLPWLVVTAGNLARNSRRATRRYRALFDSLPRTPEIHQHFETSDVTMKLRTALQSLSANDLSLLTLVALEGFAVTEAAALLGLTDGAARTRLHRVKARMRAQLESEQFDLIGERNDWD